MCRYYVRCIIFVYEDIDVEIVKWKCLKLKVKFISKNYEVLKCVLCEIIELNFKKFMFVFIGYIIRII